jgi:hypothetical protein
MCISIWCPATGKMVSKASSGPDSSIRMNRPCDACRKHFDPPLSGSALPDGMLLLCSGERQTREEDLALLTLDVSPSLSPRWYNTAEDEDNRGGRASYQPRTVDHDACRHL